MLISKHTTEPDKHNHHIMNIITTATRKMF